MTNKQSNNDADYIYIRQATKSGFIKLFLPGCFDGSYPTSKKRRGRVQEGGSVTPTITTSPEGIFYITRG